MRIYSNRETTQASWLSCPTPEGLDVDAICIFAVKDGMLDVSSVIISSLGSNSYSPAKLRTSLIDATFDT